jgi:hypothetical protein
MNPGHWAIQENIIVAFVRASGGWGKIASIEFGEERPVRQMLRYVRLGELVEGVIDWKLTGKLTDQQVSEKVEELVRDAVKDIMQREDPISAPEVESQA